MVRLTLTLSVVAALMLAAAAPPAGAKIRAIPNIDSQFRQGARDVGNAIARNRRQVRRVSVSLLPPGGRPVAIANTRRVGFPRHGKNYLILSRPGALSAPGLRPSG